MTRPQTDARGVDAIQAAELQDDVEVEAAAEVKVRSLAPRHDFGDFEVRHQPDEDVEPPTLLVGEAGFDGLRGKG